MSFYLAIIGTKDNPIYEVEFGSSKSGGDGIARVRLPTLLSTEYSPS